MQGRGYKAQPRTAFMIKSLILNPEADPCIGCCYQPTASTMDMAMDDGVQGHYGDTMTTPSTANVDTTRCQTGIYVVVVGRELSDGRRGRTMPGRYDFCSVFFFFLFFFLFSFLFSCPARRELWVWLEQFLCESFGSFLFIWTVWIPTFRCLLKNQRVFCWPCRWSLMMWFKPSSVRNSDFPWATIELRMSDSTFLSLSLL